MHFLESGCVSQPDLTDVPSMTTAKPPVRYGAVRGRACRRLYSTELHHHWDTTFGGPLKDLRAFRFSAIGALYDVA